MTKVFLDIIYHVYYEDIVDNCETASSGGGVKYGSRDRNTTPTPPPALAHAPTCNRTVSSTSTSTITIGLRIRDNVLP